MMTLLRYLTLTVLLMGVFQQYTNAQENLINDINGTFERIQGQEELSNAEKLSKLFSLKEFCDSVHRIDDSVYAKILHRIGVLDYLINENKPTDRAIRFTKEAARINTSASPGAKLALATLNFNNLARFYEVIDEHTASLAYYDSAILIGRNYPQYQNLLLVARHQKTNFLFTSGDYDKCIEESSLGEVEAEQAKDTLWQISFLNQRAQSYYFQDLFENADSDATKTIQIVRSIRDENKKTEILAGVNVYNYEFASALKLTALSIKGGQDIERFDRLLDSAAYYRKRSGDKNALCEDLLDYGYYYLLKAHDLEKAKTCFQASFKYAAGSRIWLAYGHVNLGATAEKQQQYKIAEDHYLKGFQLLNLPSRSITDEFNFRDININPEKTLLHDLLVYKTQYLLSYYKRTQDKAYLQSCIHNALITDSLISSMRKEQSSEKSKLFWRKQTRQFFTDALEACYLANDATLALYFMEKSRAVILADKLNELGASSFLPEQESGKEKALTDQIVQLQVALSTKKPGTAAYDQVETDLMEANQNFQRFVKGLEKRYPVYYQYKYEDSVATLDRLQTYLARNDQRFIHYFTGDSVIYALGVSAQKATLLQIPASQFNIDSVRDFLNRFADKQWLNNHYQGFVAAAYEFYHHLVEPFHLSPGRLIVCSDEFLIPFDALFTDTSGRHLLLETCPVSYVFSASYLFKTFPVFPETGDFAGFAPVSFNPSLGVADLNNSGKSLNVVAANYSSPLVYEKEESSRNRFLTAIGHYDVVNVFSHASAGTDGPEPTLFMQDSLIRLSELQYITRPATKLVVLSACQTMAGKTASGEGIYSLARGFASAGIPSIAATLWKADESAVYRISELFHNNIARGMAKDEALQMAKLSFLKGADREMSLPYYWANMVIIGKTDPLAIEKPNRTLIWALVAGMVGAFFLLGVIIKKSISSRPSRRGNYNPLRTQV